MSLKRVSLAWIAAGLLAAGRVFAADGAIEINQARALAGGVTPGDAPGFPVTLGRPDTYVLTGPLSVSNANTTAIEITSDDVTLDLNGFFLVGPVGCTGSGSTLTCAPAGSGSGVLAVLREGIVIRNGSVLGFASDGLVLALVESCQIENVTVAGNGGSGIHMGGTCEISGTISDRNGSSGIFVFTNDPSPADSPTDDMVARDSVLSRNRGEGVFTTSNVGRDRFVLLRSSVWANGRTGVDLRTEGGVRDCAIFGNQGGGINLGVNSTDPDSGLVRGNAVRSNLYGFSLDPLHVGYTHNNFSGNTNASSGGVQIGPNVCESDTVCP